MGTSGVQTTGEQPITKKAVRRGPPLGRHVAAVGVVLVLIVGFRWFLKEPGDDGLSNLVLADTSLVLLCLILILGAIARFVPRARRFVPWGRELGIAMFVTAGLHVAMLIDTFASLDDALFGVHGALGRYDFWTAANWVGVVALVYALVLAITSNDFSQRLLGRGWKFTQRQAYTLFILAWLHTAAFLVDIEEFPPAFNWFWLFTIPVVVAQVSGFVHTVRSPRGPSPQRAPRKSRADSSRAASSAYARWAAVIALWSLLIIGIYLLGPA
jgi:DMSO/TMAO reductase YedYZ heme-binding membrane subunit